MHSKQVLGRAILAGVVVIFLTLIASAALIPATWLGGAGNWSDASKWSGGVVPNNAGADHFIVFIDAGHAAASIVTQNVDVMIDALTISAGDQVHVPDGRTLTLYSGAGTSTITNHGTLALHSAGNLTNLRIEDGTVLAGGGTIALGNHVNNRLYGVTAASKLINLDNTIEGAGQLGAGTMALDNRGLISASLPAGLVVRPAAGQAVLNSGVMQATNGATLQLSLGPFTNHLGVIRAANGSTVEVSNVTITGGLLTSAGSGVIRAIVASTLAELIQAGRFEVANGVAVDLTGTISNTGNLFLHSTGSPTDLRIATGATLSGGGTVTMSDHANNRIYGVVGGETLTNAAGHTIVGAGHLGISRTRIVNRGTVAATQPTRLLIEPGVIYPFRNESLLLATNGATLRLNAGIFTNHLGVIHAANGSTVEVSNVTIAGGLLTSAGTGVFRATAASVLTGLTVNATLEVVNDVAVDLAGVISNQQVMTLQSSGGFSAFRVLGSATLTGGGSLVMGNHANNRIYGVFSGETLTNAAGHTIVGAGQLGVNRTKLVNAGIIRANQPTPLLIDPQDALGLINTGTLWVDAGSTLFVEGGGFSNFVSAASMLTGGAYRVAGTFKFTSAKIGHNAASLILDSATWSIVDHFGADAVANLTTNTGRLTLQNGAVFRCHTNFVNGTHACGLPAEITVNGASFYVTNATGTATLDVRSGTVRLLAGTLKCDALWLTNACARLFRSGGSLDVADLHLPDHLDADGDGLLNRWELDHGLDPFSDAGDDGAAGDPDGDGYTNAQEQAAGTHPRDSTSALRILAIAREGNDVRVTWSCVPGKVYRVQTNSVPGSGYADLTGDIAPGGTTTNHLHSGGALGQQYYYRVRLAP